MFLKYLLTSNIEIYKNISEITNLELTLPLDKQYFFLFVPCELSPFLQTIEYKNSYRSDHTPVLLHI